MDLFQLEVFVTVAREGSFSRAAEKLYRTQPAVSQAIRKLEDELGEPLLDRSSRDGHLTDAGSQRDRARRARIAATRRIRGRHRINCLLFDFH